MGPRFRGDDVTELATITHEDREDVRIPMRDGVHLAADIYRPGAESKVPALLALSPYGKELQALALTMPPQARPSPCGTAGSKPATSAPWSSTATPT